MLIVFEWAYDKIYMLLFILATAVGDLGSDSAQFVGFVVKLRWVMEVDLKFLVVGGGDFKAP